MNLQALEFHRPDHLQASLPPEERGLARDQVKLLISTSAGHHHSCFANLVNFLLPHDLLVVNRSATMPASLGASSYLGTWTINLSTHYGQGLWLTEPRWSHDKPGPLPLKQGEEVSIAGLKATVIAPYPSLPRLVFMQIEGDVYRTMLEHGRAIRYAYTAASQQLEHYQTIFADTPGSAEMPSAARPFSSRVLSRLKSKGIGIASITLHTGVSSLELKQEVLSDNSLYPEPFEVPAKTAQLIRECKAQGGRVIAVGTTVVRALESAVQDHQVVASKGFTRRFIHPQSSVQVVDGLITGFHDPKASHLAMLYAIAGQTLVQEAYQEAIRHNYLWHEFGDSHLLLPQ